MNHLIVATLVGATCLLLAPLAALARIRRASGLTETLAVKSSKGRVLVEVLLDNQSARAVHVPRAIASESALSGRLFEIRDAGSGAPIAYVGRMVKRGTPTAADFLTLKPRGRHRNTIDIGDSYAFKPGRHSYRLSHQASFLADLDRLDQDALPLAVAPVRFAHTAP